MPDEQPPHVISDALNAELARIRGEIPADRHGVLTVGASTTGLMAGAGWRPNPNLTLTAYAGREWGGGWVAAATGTLVW